MSFESLGLSEELLRAVSEAGYTEPTPIQLEAIPAILKGGDLMAGAQTGTGKTAGFALPILELLKGRTASRPRGPRALVLAPTRELAAQVDESVRTYGRHTKIKSIAVFGGVGIHPQIAALKSGIDVLVATPGRLLDHHQQRTVDLSSVEILVLDEADRMLDMGFIRDIKRILALLPARRQNLLFSATFSDEIRALADSLLDEPALIQVERRNSTVEMIAQKVYPVDRDRKAELLTHLIRTNQWFQVLVFTRTKHGANRLAERLAKDGITALAIHGNKSQGARTRALAEFKSGTLQVLVATDIAARGIDIEELPHVVNFDLPNVPEDYVHRIGRTGRAGATGEAVSLVCVDEHALLRDIERVIGRKIATEVVAGFTPDPNARAEPLTQRQGRGAPGRGAKADAPAERRPRAPQKGAPVGTQRTQKVSAGSTPANGGNAGRGGGARSGAPRTGAASHSTRSAPRSPRQR